MRKLLLLSAILICIVSGLSAAAKPKILAFGKSLPVKLFVGPTEDRTVPINVRALLWDGKVKEFTTGEPHEITDRLFVVRRAFRLNDNLPAETRKQPHWIWQVGGWLLVDRSNGHVTNIALPLFDPFYSDASWYRDYVAYCGVSDTGEKLYAVVAQVGSRKAVLRKELSRVINGDAPDAYCSTPQWDRNPSRVTFLPKNGTKLTYSVQGRAADIVNDTPETEE